MGKTKAHAIKEHLQKINSEIEITTHALHLDTSNITLLKQHDIIIDATDNLTTRFLINDYAKKNNIPWIYGAALKDQGYVMPIYPANNQPCLSCFLKPAELETCDLSGVLSTTTVLVATLQTQLAIQILSKNNQPKSNLTHISLRTLQTKLLHIKQSKTCPTCTKKYPYLIKTETPISQFCATGRFQIHAQNWTTDNFAKKRTLWKNQTDFKEDSVSISIENITLFQDGRVLIKANSKKEALSLYSKYIGN